MLLAQRSARIESAYETGKVQNLLPFSEDVMAIEAKRGCGYRKIGGIYLVSDGLGIPCHRLPFPLDVCPTCGHGIKQARGWTWVDGEALFSPPCKVEIITHCAICPICNTSPLKECGLLWVGARFYRTPEEFTFEAHHLGVSRRIKAIPRGFKLGETWVLLGHPNAIKSSDGTLRPGVFHAFKPCRIEMIIKVSEATEDKLTELKKSNITPIIVPDNDRDHQGTVYDEENTLTI